MIQVDLLGFIKSFFHVDVGQLLICYLLLSIWASLQPEDEDPTE